MSYLVEYLTSLPSVPADSFRNQDIRLTLYAKVESKVQVILPRCSSISWMLFSCKVAKYKYVGNSTTLFIAKYLRFSRRYQPTCFQQNRN